MAEEKKKKTYIDTFTRHGVELSDTGSNWIGDCPFCAKEEHFFVDEKTGRWDCKYCQEEGNQVTFLTKIADVYRADMPNSELARLARIRRLPVAAFRRWGFGYSGGEWMLPVWSEKNTVRDIRRYNGQKMMSTDFCDLQLLGARELAVSQPGQRVWVCEGEWDAIALRWLLDNTTSKYDIVVALPGAKSMQDKWVKLFEKREVILCFDNDDPGDKGAVKTATMLGSTPKNVLFLNWPEDLPNGWDLNDQISDWIESKIPYNRQLQGILALLRPYHRHSVPAPEKPVDPASVDPGTFDDVLAVFRRWVKTNPDFEDGLAIALATCLANDVPGDPLWMYIVGPPSSGKTLILLSLSTSERTHFESTFTAASLVSGFNTNPDPSLIPQLNGKCAVFKDGTELLTIHPDARREAYSTLRGAYDGQVSKPFGNGIRRVYKDLHFNMLIGITPAIHGDNQATMGERFLKYEMREKMEEAGDKIRRAVGNLEKKQQMEEELAAASERFLLRQVNPNEFRPIPEVWLNKLVALAQILSMLRATVDRESFGDRDIKYRPTHESGTRVAIQLAKLGKLLCVVYNKPEVDATIYRMMRRVAMDSSIGYHVDLVRSLMRTGNRGLTVAQIGEIAGMNRSLLTKKLEDLEQLRIVYRVRPEQKLRERGTNPHQWFVTDHVAKLWNDSLTGAPNANAGQLSRVLQRPARPATNGHINGFVHTNGHQPSVGGQLQGRQLHSTPPNVRGRVGAPGTVRRPQSPLRPRFT